MKKNSSDAPVASTPRRRAARGPGRTARTQAGPQPFSADELRRISRQISSAWFVPPAGSRLTLLEIDPWRVHAYWFIAEADLEAARATLPRHGQDTDLVLRFTDISPGLTRAEALHARFDIPVQRANNNWYVDLWRDAKRYSAELGLRAPDGAFVPLARSNEAETPRGGPSPQLDFRQLEVRAPRALAPGSASGGTDLSEQLLKDLYPQRVRSGDGFPLAMAEPEAWPPEEPAFPQLAEEADAEGLPFPEAMPEDRPSDTGSGGSAAAAGFPVIASDEIDPYRARARRAEARLLAGLETRLPEVAAESVAPTDVTLAPQPLPIRLAAEPAGSAGNAPRVDHPENVHPFADAAGGMPVSLESLLSGAVSSYGQGVPPAHAAVEVLIQGRGVPDARFLLFGKPVPADADGVFTVRLPLERGPELAALLHRLRERHGHEGEG